ncbi:MAG: flagellar hook-length control protein FliK, partial [Clostridia bacterium]|nr:flagellar hook-length control protein FliK [Clostridia bacterium]
EKKEKKTEQEEKPENEKINGLIDKITEQKLGEDVEFSEDDLKNLIITEAENEGMPLTEEELLKITEILEKKMMEKVSEVGPQSVETEKITLNKEDENKTEETDKDSGENSRSFDVSLEKEGISEKEETEPLTDTMNQQGSTEEKMFDEDGKSKKETKMNVTDLRRKGFENTKDSSMEIDVKTDNLTDIKTDTENKILSNNGNMQETIDIIEQVAEQVDVTVMEDKSEMVIKLKPDHLGKVTMQISVENGNVTAKFLAESQRVKEILEANFQDLKDMLNKQGMSVQNLSVSIGNDRQNQEFESRRQGLFNRKNGISRINPMQANSVYGYENSYSNEQILRNYYPDSTVSFSA